MNSKLKLYIAQVFACIILVGVFVSIGVGIHKLKLQLDHTELVAKLEARYDILPAWGKNNAGQ